MKFSFFLATERKKETLTYCRFGAAMRSSFVHLCAFYFYFQLFSMHSFLFEDSVGSDAYVHCNVFISGTRNIHNKTISMLHKNGTTKIARKNEENENCVGILYNFFSFYISLRQFCYFFSQKKNENAETNGNIVRSQIIWLVFWVNRIVLSEHSISCV